MACSTTPLTLAVVVRMMPAITTLMPPTAVIRLFLDGNEKNELLGILGLNDVVGKIGLIVHKALSIS